MQYSERLIAFLKDNPKMRLNPTDIARLWKRRVVQVEDAAILLWNMDLINIDKKGNIYAA